MLSQHLRSKVFARKIPCKTKSSHRPTDQSLASPLLRLWSWVSNFDSSQLPLSWSPVLPGSAAGPSPAGPSAPLGTWPCSSCWGSCTGSRSIAPGPSPAPPCRGVCLQRWTPQAPFGELAPAGGWEEVPGKRVSSHSLPTGEGSGETITLPALLN